MPDTNFEPAEFYTQTVPESVEEIRDLTTPVLDEMQPVIKMIDDFADTCPDDMESYFFKGEKMLGYTWQEAHPVSFHDEFNHRADAEAILGAMRGQSTKPVSMNELRGMYDFDKIKVSVIETSGYIGKDHLLPDGTSPLRVAQFSFPFSEKEMGKHYWPGNRLGNGLQELTEAREIFLIDYKGDIVESLVPSNSLLTPIGCSGRSNVMELSSGGIARMEGWHVPFFDRTDAEHYYDPSGVLSLTKDEQETYGKILTGAKQDLVTATAEKIEKNDRDFLEKAPAFDHDSAASSRMEDKLNLIYCRAAIDRDRVYHGADGDHGIVGDANRLEDRLFEKNKLMQATGTKRISNKTAGIIKDITTGMKAVDTVNERVFNMTKYLTSWHKVEASIGSYMSNNDLQFQLRKSNPVDKNIGITLTGDTDKDLSQIIFCRRIMPGADTLSPLDLNHSETFEKLERAVDGVIEKLVDDYNAKVDKEENPGAADDQLDPRFTLTRDQMKLYIDRMPDGRIEAVHTYDGIVVRNLDSNKRQEFKGERGKYYLAEYDLSIPEKKRPPVERPSEKLHPVIRTGEQEQAKADKEINAIEEYPMKKASGNVIISRTSAALRVIDHFLGFERQYNYISSDDVIARTIREDEKYTTTGEILQQLDIYPEPVAGRLTRRTVCDFFMNNKTNIDKMAPNQIKSKIALSVDHVIHNKDLINVEYDFVRKANFVETARQVISDYEDAKDKVIEFGKPDAPEKDDLGKDKPDTPVTQTEKNNAEKTADHPEAESKDTEKAEEGLKDTDKEDPDDAPVKKPGSKADDPVEKKNPSDEKKQDTAVDPTDTRMEKDDPKGEMDMEHDPTDKKINQTDVPTKSDADPSEKTEKSTFEEQAEKVAEEAERLRENPDAKVHLTREEVSDFVPKGSFFDAALFQGVRPILNGRPTLDKIDAHKPAEISDVKLQEIRDKVYADKSIPDDKKEEAVAAEKASVQAKLDGLRSSICTRAEDIRNYVSFGPRDTFDAFKKADLTLLVRDYERAGGKISGDSFLRSKVSWMDAYGSVTRMLNSNIIETGIAKLAQSLFGHHDDARLDRQTDDISAREKAEMETNRVASRLEDNYGIRISSDKKQEIQDKFEAAISSRRLDYNVDTRDPHAVKDAGDKIGRFHDQIVTDIIKGKVVDDVTKDTAGKIEKITGEKLPESSVERIRQMVGDAVDNRKFDILTDNKRTQAEKLEADEKKERTQDLIIKRETKNYFVEKEADKIEARAGKNGFELNDDEKTKLRETLGADIDKSSRSRFINKDPDNADKTKAFESENFRYETKIFKELVGGKFAEYSADKIVALSKELDKSSTGKGLSDFRDELVKTIRGDVAAGRVTPLVNEENTVTRQGLDRESLNRYENGIVGQVVKDHNLDSDLARSFQRMSPASKEETLRDTGFLTAEEKGRRFEAREEIADRVSFEIEKNTGTRPDEKTEKEIKDRIETGFESREYDVHAGGYLDPDLRDKMEAKNEEFIKNLTSDFLKEEKQDSVEKPDSADGQDSVDKADGTIETDSPVKTDEIDSSNDLPEKDLTATNTEKTNAPEKITEEPAGNDSPVTEDPGPVDKEDVKFAEADSDTSDEPEKLLEGKGKGNKPDDDTDKVLAAAIPPVDTEKDKDPDSEVDKKPDNEKMEKDDGAPDNAVKSETSDTFSTDDFPKNDESIEKSDDTNDTADNEEAAPLSQSANDTQNPVLDQETVKTYLSVEDKPHITEEDATNAFADLLVHVAGDTDFVSDFIDQYGEWLSDHPDLIPDLLSQGEEIAKAAHSDVNISDTAVDVAARIVDVAAQNPDQAMDILVKAIPDADALEKTENAYLDQMENEAFPDPTEIDTDTLFSDEFLESAMRESGTSGADLDKDFSSTDGTIHDMGNSYDTVEDKILDAADRYGLNEDQTDLLRNITMSNIEYGLDPASNEFQEQLDSKAQDIDAHPELYMEVVAEPDPMETIPNDYDPMEYSGADGEQDYAASDELPWA